MPFLDRKYIESCHGSQLPISAWHKVIGDPTIADAICDRLVNNSYRIELYGGSVRMKFKLD
jgi:DNA replication protein DnaC